MPTHEERLKILHMVEEGQITAEQAVKLMDALGSTHEQPAPQSSSVPTYKKPSRWFRIRVTDVSSGRVCVDVRLPITLMSAGAKLGARFSPDVTGLDMEKIMELIHSGATGCVFEADQPQNERVQVFIE